MNLDIDQLINEDVEIKNEMKDIFKKLENGYSDLLKAYENFEKPLEKIIDNFKEYARESSATDNQEDSPFFNYAKTLESLIDGQKQYAYDVNDNVVLSLQQIISKSDQFDNTIKELNKAVKSARNLKKKIEKLEDDIEVLHAKGKPEKIPKKESDKSTKESEYALARDRVQQEINKFN